MNKITKLLAIVALVGSTTLWSCKGDTGELGPKGDKGETGAPGSNGVDGEDGKDGNANVESYSFTIKTTDWVTDDVASIGTGATSKWGVYSFTNDKITTEKAALVYIKTNDGYRKALPSVFTIDMNGTLEHVEYGYATGRIDILYRLQNQLFGGNVEYAAKRDLNIEIILVTKTISGALENSGIDLNDYNAVVDFVAAQ